MSEARTRAGAIRSEIRRLVGIPETAIYTGDIDTCFMEACKRIEALERERDRMSSALWWIVKEIEGSFDEYILATGESFLGMLRDKAREAYRREQARGEEAT